MYFSLLLTVYTLEYQRFHQCNSTERRRRTPKYLTSKPYVIGITYNNAGISRGTFGKRRANFTDSVFRLRDGGDAACPARRVLLCLPIVVHGGNTVCVLVRSVEPCEYLVTFPLTSQQMAAQRWMVCPTRRVSLLSSPVVVHGESASNLLKERVEAGECCGTSSLTFWLTIICAQGRPTIV